MKHPTQRPTSKTKRPKEKKPALNRFALIDRKLPGRRFVEFPQMKGRTVEKIGFFTTAGYHSIAVRFQDKTALTLVINPGFMLKADYDDWKTGDARKLKSWPAIPSQGWIGRE